MAFQMTLMSSRMSSSVSATSCGVSSCSCLPILVRGVRSSSILATASRAALLLPGLSGCGGPRTPWLRAGGARLVSASDADDAPPLASSNSSSEEDEVAELESSSSSSPSLTAPTPAAI